jgi:predicted aspartyl protease
MSLTKRHSLAFIILPLITTLLAGCAAPTASNEAVSESMLNQLRSQSIDLKSLGLTESGRDLQFDAAWDAPALVRVPMLWHNDLPAVGCLINNGRPVPLILDTGSQGCVIEAATAVAHGLRIASPEEVSFSLAGISGSEPALMGLPNLVSIGEWKLSRFPMLVRTRVSAVSRPMMFGPRRFEFNIWGMNPTRKLCSYMTLDYPRREVVFGFQSSYKTDAKLVWKAPLRFIGDLPHVRLRSHDVSWTAMVDTGASSPMELDETTAKKLKLHDIMKPAEGARIGVGAASGEQNGFLGITRIDDVEGIGPTLKNVPALVVSDRSKIGTGVLKRFRVTFDFRRDLMWVEDVK